MDVQCLLFSVYIFTALLNMPEKELHSEKGNTENELHNEEQLLLTCVSAFFLKQWKLIV